MNGNPLILSTLAEQRRRELLEEARRARAATGLGRRRGGRLILRLGSIRITISREVADVGGAL